MPAKSRLSWRICRLHLTADGVHWFATGSKANRVAVIELPDLLETAHEEQWIAEIEARFERQAFDPFEPEPARGLAEGSSA